MKTLFEQQGVYLEGELQQEKTMRKFGISEFSTNMSRIFLWVVNWRKVELFENSE